MDGVIAGHTHWFMADRSHDCRRARNKETVSNIGLIAGNVYLFAASQGLAAWFHNCNKEAAASDFKLRSNQRVLFAQTVGYPA
jgi:hypothetical protein